MKKLLARVIKPEGEIWQGLKTVRNLMRGVRARLRIYPLCRPFLRAIWYKRLTRLIGPPQRGGQAGLTPLILVKNEDYWIETIVRTVCKVFSHVVVVDDNSEDSTRDVLAVLKGSEGLKFDLISFPSSPVNKNIVVNLILDKWIKTEWFMFVDGDELFFEKGLRTLERFCASEQSRPYEKLSVHALYLHPQNILKNTPAFCNNVRYAHGRCFKTSLLRLPEPGWRPLPYIHCKTVGTFSPQPFAKQFLQTKVLPYSPQARFFDDVHMLHAAFNRRSSLSRDWSGVSSRASSHVEWREQNYIAPDSAYVPLSSFPKEATECAYSSHNEDLSMICSDSGIDFD